MSERKTRGRQKIPIKLIETKDELLVSFSKRRVGVYKKASELSTLCGVDVGAFIFSPSGIPHAFLAPDLKSVVYGRRNPDLRRDRYGREVVSGQRVRIRELNERVDQVIEEQEREEKSEKELDAAVGGGEVQWWEVPVGSLDAEQLKEHIKWFKDLKDQIGKRVQELKNGGSSSHAPPLGGGGGDHMSGECFFPPISMDYDGGGGTSHVENQHLFPPHPPPPPYFDAGGGGSCVAAEQYLFPPPPSPPPPTHVESSVGGGSGLTPGNYYFPPPSLNLFEGGGDGHAEQYFYAPSPLGGGIGLFSADANGYFSREGQELYFPAAHGGGDAGPSRRSE